MDGFSKGCLDVLKADQVISVDLRRSRVYSRGNLVGLKSVSRGLCSSVFQGRFRDFQEVSEEYLKVSRLFKGD